MEQEKNRESGAAPDLPLRPARHAEHRLVTSVLNGTYPPGAKLPNERSLAVELGVTRPTLREILQRLARHGWLTIRQGKPTVVNDYWDTGGMGVLSTLAGYMDYLPEGFFNYLLEVRADILPGMARHAVERAPSQILTYLEKYPHLDNEAAEYARYDWGLQVLLARCTDNPVYVLLFNDFENLFETLALRYFGLAEARRASRKFYGKLIGAIGNGARQIEEIVRAAMEKSIKIYATLT
ncbi:MAG: GntR family transcriptional regulator [Deltaproteobacteria bacterium]|nr:GntR family transcriptional regulator [Deltaproteobacteria bacterium]MBW1818694.1 GntR family transcriptional regulator [Deltaproteobacteria bacterium]MBW2284322.1 GntR family transcriptional regulator [Deltaproteobacteria bacterium]